MWAALATTVVALVVAVMAFRSRTKWIERAAKAETEVEEYERIVENLLAQIETLALGDHGLGHDDMGDVLRPRPLPASDD